MGGVMARNETPKVVSAWQILQEGSFILYNLDGQVCDDSEKLLLHSLDLVAMSYNGTKLCTWEEVLDYAAESKCVFLYYPENKIWSFASAALVEEIQRKQDINSCYVVYDAQKLKASYLLPSMMTAQEVINAAQILWQLN
jgi:hypothetical protein